VTVCSLGSIASAWQSNKQVRGAEINGSEVGESRMCKEGLDRDVMDVL